MKRIYIIFSYTGTYFSFFLRKMSGEKYIHVSIAFDGDLVEVYSFGRKNPKWILPSGFVSEDFLEVTNIFKKTICQIYAIDITNNKYKKLKREIEKYNINQDKYHYNIMGLAHIKFNKIYHRRHHFVCSQFIGKLLSDTDIYDFKKDYSLIQPRDIRAIPQMELVYEGVLSNYLEMLR